MTFPRYSLALGQGVALCRMPVLAKCQKFLRAHFSSQSEFDCALTVLLTRDRLALLIIIPNCQMLLKVSLSIGEAVLCLRRDHYGDFSRTKSGRRVSSTHQHEGNLLHWRHE